MSKLLHTLQDGTEVRLLSARLLIAIPVWKNNRNLHKDHVDKLLRDTAKNPKVLDHNYFVGVLEEEDAAGKSVEQPYIIDGQHRYHVLRQYFQQPHAEDFEVMVYQKRCSTEAELIDTFNAINTIQPLKLWEDEASILNSYVESLMYEFNKKKVQWIRPGNPRRPYLSSEALREGLRAVLPHLVKSQEGAEEFARQARLWNDRHVKDADGFVLEIRARKDAEMFEKGAKAGFVLAYHEKLRWIEDIVRIRNGNGTMR
jgi:hypothetical protein